MRSLLIVDDDEKVIQGLLHHVRWEKFDIEVTDTAYNGEEALAKIKASPPDMVITDIYMPKMDGLQLIEQLRETHPSIYIIIHSGYDDFENARRAMRLGVQHFFYKPATVTEIESVMLEIVQEIEVQQKQQRLLEQYEGQMKTFLSYTKDAFIRELLTTRYKEADLPREKLELLQMDTEAYTVVASLSLIRPPYLTKSKEREWQLMKFGAGNIIQETIEKEVRSGEVDVHVITYSDTAFVIVFTAKKLELELTEVSKQAVGRMGSNILLYLRLSYTAGIGGIKKGVHEMISSFLESQRALEAAEYQEMNQVFVFDEVYGQEHTAFHYPLDLLKEIQEAIGRKEHDKLLDIWGRIEHEVLVQNRMPMVMMQNLCVSTLSAFMMEHQSFEQLGEEQPTMATWMQQIYAMTTSVDLCRWMKETLQGWIGQTKKELTSKKSNKLIQEVKEHVEQYYDREITLADIADSLYVNRNYLSQLFKRVTGESFVTYLNKFRIELAKEKLKEGHYMVYEVSEMVGYQNPTYFSQVFKSITGVSPSDYYND